MSAQTAHHQIPRIQRPTKCTETAAGRPVRCGIILRASFTATAVVPSVAAGMATQVPANHLAGQSAL